TALDLVQRPRAAHGHARRFVRAGAVEFDVEQHAGPLRRPFLEALDQRFLEAGRAELARAVGEVGTHEFAAAPRAALVHLLDHRGHHCRLASAGRAATLHQALIAARAISRGDGAILLDRVGGEVETEVLALLRHTVGAAPGLGIFQTQRIACRLFTAEQTDLAALTLP